MINSGISPLRQLKNSGFIEFSLFKTAVCIFGLCSVYMPSIECLFLKCSIIYSNPGHSFFLTMLKVKGDSKKGRFQKNVAASSLSFRWNCLREGIFEF